MSSASPFLPSTGEVFYIVCLIQYESHKATEVLSAPPGEYGKLRKDIARLMIPAVKNNNIKKYSKRNNTIELWWTKQVQGGALQKTFESTVCKKVQARDLQDMNIVDVQIFYLPLSWDHLPDHWKPYWRMTGSPSWSPTYSSAPAVPYSTPPPISSSAKEPIVTYSARTSFNPITGLPPKPELFKPIFKGTPATLEDGEILSPQSSGFDETRLQASQMYNPHPSSESRARSISDRTSLVCNREGSLSPPLPDTPPPAFGIHLASLSHCLRLLHHASISNSNWNFTARCVEERTRLLFEAAPSHRPNFSSDAPRTIYDAILKALLYSHTQYAIKFDMQLRSAILQSKRDIGIAEKHTQDLQDALEKERMDHTSSRSTILKLQDDLATLDERRKEQEADCTQMRDALETSRQDAARSQVKLERIRAEQSTPFLAPALLDAFTGIGDMAHVVNSCDA